MTTNPTTRRAHPGSVSSWVKMVLETAQPQRTTRCLLVTKAFKAKRALRGRKVRMEGAGRKDPASIHPSIHPKCSHMMVALAYISFSRHVCCRSMAPDYNHMLVESPSWHRVHELDMASNDVEEVALDLEGGEPSSMVDRPPGNSVRISSFGRAKLALRFWFAEHRIAHLISRDLNITNEAIAGRFDRLDALGRGALDDSRTQLLLFWAFDVDMKREDWDAILYHLAGATSSCLVQRQRLLAWTGKLLKRRTSHDSCLTSCCHGVLRVITLLSERVAASSFIVDHTGSFARYWRAVRAFTALYMFLTVVSGAIYVPPDEIPYRRRIDLYG